MRRMWTLPDGRQVDLTYFVNWRPWLWAPSVAHAMEFLGDLRGKRLLEVGGKDARMSSLLAMAGAEVTMLDIHLPACAHEEVAKWNVAGRVRLIETDGGFGCIAGETFDAVFTKSFLWCLEDLSGMLDQIDEHLAAGAKVAFVENYRGGTFLFWLRHVFVHGGMCPYTEATFRNIRPEQIRLFHERFADVTVRRSRYFVYEVFGHKRT